MPEAITKFLIPPGRRDSLTRPRLLEFLEDAEGVKLVILRAPAGYGKTTLLAEFARGRQECACWLSLDEEDADPARFLELLVCSLAQRYPGFGRSTLAALRQDTQGALASLVNEAHAQLPPGPTLLFLDDFHHVSPALDALLNRLLALLPPKLRLYLATRSLPEIDMISLTARGEVTGLSARDLAFTPEELGAYLEQSRGIHLGEEDARRLIEESEGWITAVLLTSQLLGQQLVATLSDAPDGQPLMFRYLAQEVFDHLPEAERRFLLDTSVLDLMSPELCDRLLRRSDSAQLLQSLERREVLLARLETEGESWYRYHQLLQEYLQEQLRRRDPEGFARLHRRAAEIFLGEGHLREAVRHFLAGQDWSSATEAILRAAPQLLEQRQQRTLLRWLEAIPRAVKAQRAELLVLQGRAYLREEELAPASEALEEARDIAAREGQWELAGQALAWLAAAERAQLHLGPARQAAEQALELLPEAPSVERAYALRSLGLAHWLEGDPPRGRRRLEEALEMFRQVGSPAGLGEVHQSLGRLLAHAGRTDQAVGHYQEALQLHGRAGFTAGALVALNSLGVLYHCRGEYGRARQLLGEALEKARAAGTPSQLAIILGSLGELERDFGQLEAAEGFLAEAQALAERSGLGAELIDILAERAQLAARQGDHEGARRLARQALAEAERSGARAQLPVAHLAAAAADLYLNRPQEARESLQLASAGFEELANRRGAVRARCLLAESLRQLSDPAARSEFQWAVQQGREYGVEGLVSAAVSAYPGLLAWAREEGVPVLSLDGGLPGPAGSSLHLLALDQGRILFDGKRVSGGELDSASAKELLFYLAEHPQGRSWEQAAADLWPEKPPRAGRSLFHSCLHRIRRATQAQAVLHQDGLYRLNPAWLSYDLEQFRRLVARARGTAPAREQVRLLEQALRLHRSPYLPGHYSEWCEGMRVAVEAERVEAAAQLAELYLRGGRLEDGEALAQQVLEQAPYRESLYRALASAHLAAGDRGRAWQWLERCRASLEGVGLELSPQTRTLYPQESGRTER